MTEQAQATSSGQSMVPFAILDLLTYIQELREDPDRNHAEQCLDELNNELKTMGLPTIAGLLIEP